MCGIVGILSDRAVNQDIYDALTIIQHRGQDAAGIMTSDGERVYLRKSYGLVRNAIREKHMRTLNGTMGIGHVRYPTAGSDSQLEAQPFYVNSPFGLAIAHNGNLVNSAFLAQDLRETDRRHLNTTSDSEVLLNVLAHELMNCMQEGDVPHTPALSAALSSAKAGDLPSTEEPPVLGNRITEPLFSALRRVYTRARGAFSAVVLIQGHGLLAFRDPHGIRPLVFGVRESGSQREYMVASETIALDALNFEVIDDVKPGEAVFISEAGEVSRHICADEVAHRPCLFEYIYLSRPDSVIDNISVYRARCYMGKYLAERIRQAYPDLPFDVVIPIPDTSRSVAHALAQALNLPYSEGFVKNRYIGRTFIMPGQSVRRSSVRLKLNVMKDEVRDKRVLLVDDSIVRGTTSKEIVRMTREVGARSVYFASAAPPVTHPNVFGIDMPSADELIAHQKSLDEIAAYMDVDGLIYQSLEDVCAAINDAAKTETDKIACFEDSIFTGKYHLPDITSDYLNRLNNQRNNAAREKTVM